MKHLRPPQPPVDGANGLDVARWEGAAAVQRCADGGVVPVRLDYRLNDLLHPHLVAAARFGSGVRLRFSVVGADYVELEVAFATHFDGGAFGSRVDGVARPPALSPPLAPLPEGLDGARRAEMMGAHPRAGAPPAPVPVRFDGLYKGGATRVVEIWAPHDAAVRYVSLRASPGGSIRPPPEDARPWLVVYGSSITAGDGAATPLATWPAVAAAAGDVRLRNLGFAGACHMDPLVARAIAGTAAGALALEIGVNVFFGRSMTERTFEAAVLGFLLNVRDGHPDAPCVLISPLFVEPREAARAGAGLSLPAIRATLAALVAKLVRRGDGKLHYLDGRALLGPDDAGLLRDGLHPTPAGHAAIGTRFAAWAFGRDGALLRGRAADPR